jgi:hypothetical protein
LPDEWLEVDAAEAADAPADQEDDPWWQQPLHDALAAAASALPCCLLPAGSVSSDSLRRSAESAPRKTGQEAAAAAPGQDDSAKPEESFLLWDDMAHEPWMLLGADALRQPTFEEVPTASMCGDDEAMFRYLDELMDENSSQFADNTSSSTSADEWMERADQMVFHARTPSLEVPTPPTPSCGSSSYQTAASSETSGQATCASSHVDWAAGARGCRKAATDLGSYLRAGAQKRREADMQEMLQSRTAAWVDMFAGGSSAAEPLLCQGVQAIPLRRREQCCVSLF